MKTRPEINASPIRCGRMKCKWRGYESELLEVPDPSYVGIAVTNNVCPICKNKSYMHMTPGEIKAWERKKAAQLTSEAQP